MTPDNLTNRLRFGLKKTVTPHGLIISHDRGPIVSDQILSAEVARVFGTALIAQENGTYFIPLITSKPQSGSGASEPKKTSSQKSD